MAIHDLPEDEVDKPKKTPSKEWKEKHKIYLDDDDIIILNKRIELEKNQESFTQEQRDILYKNLWDLYND